MFIYLHLRWEMFISMYISDTAYCFLASKQCLMFRNVHLLKSVLGDVNQHTSCWCWPICQETMSYVQKRSSIFFVLFHFLVYTLWEQIFLGNQLPHCFPNCIRITVFMVRYGCPIGCFTNTCFWWKGMAQPALQVFGGCFEVIQKEFWFWQLLVGVQVISVLSFFIM